MNEFDKLNDEFHNEILKQKKEYIRSRNMFFFYSVLGHGFYLFFSIILFTVLALLAISFYVFVEMPYSTYAFFFAFTYSVLAILNMKKLYYGLNLKSDSFLNFKILLKMMLRVYLKDKDNKPYHNFVGYKLTEKHFDDFTNRVKDSNITEEEYEFLAHKIEAFMSDVNNDHSKYIEDFNYSPLNDDKSRKSLSKFYNHDFRTNLCLY